MEVNAEVVNVATPLTRVAVPSVTVLKSFILKLTLPEGTVVVEVVGITVALKVINWPEADGLGVEVRAVVLGLLPPVDPTV